MKFNFEFHRPGYPRVPWWMYIGGLANANRRGKICLSSGKIFWTWNQLKIWPKYHFDTFRAKKLFGQKNVNIAQPIFGTNRWKEKIYFSGEWRVSRVTPPKFKWEPVGEWRPRGCCTYFFCHPFRRQNANEPHQPNALIGKLVPTPMIIQFPFTHSPVQKKCIPPKRSFFTKTAFR